MTVPNLFIVGAPKCATTALARYLGAHPDIGAMPKEVHHFGSDLDYRVPGGRVGRAVYLERAQRLARDHRIVVDASVLYLYSRLAAQEIFAFNPNARIIIMLRKPAEMIGSLHQQLIKSRDEVLTDLAEALAAEPRRLMGEGIPPGAIVVDALHYRGVASYADQVRRYLDLFPADHVKVILYDDVQDNMRAVYEDTCAFCGLDPDPTVDLSPVNEAAEVRAPMLVELQRRYLYRYDVYRRLKAILPKAIRAPIWDFWQKILYRKGRKWAVDPALLDNLTVEFSGEVARLEDLIDRDLTSWKSTGAL
jgi:hypothetical protein